MAASSFTLFVGDIPVVCTRRQVKNVSLRCGADGSVRMSIPWSCPRSFAEMILARKAGWVRTIVARARGSSPRDTTTARLWGETLPTDIVPSPTAHSPKAHVEDGRIRILMPEASASDRAALHEAREAALDALYKTEVERKLPTLVPLVEAEVGAHATSWSVRKMRTRWGSCTPARKTIRLSSTLAAYPERCLAYVAVHECCHLLEASHNARFHALMDAHCPDWRAIKAQLNGRLPTCGS